MNEEQFFNHECLMQLIKSMGFGESVFLEEGAEAMIIEIANEFMAQLLEESIKFSSKRCYTEDNKSSKPKITIEDIKYVLKNRLNVPVQNFSVENAKQD